MSNEEVARFVEAVNRSPELQRQCRDVLVGSEDPGGFTLLGRANGFDFSEEDVRSYFGIVLGQPEPRELADDDLARVSGGAGGFAVGVARLQSRALFRDLGGTPSWALAGVGSPP